MIIPDDFPRFTVPGHEKETQSLRELYWLHYPGSGPKSTMWDSWLASPALWPAIETQNYMDSMRAQWSDILSARVIDSDGYVSVHQHPSIAHPLGWPFPFWFQGQGGYGWHFSLKDTVGPPWGPGEPNKTDNWIVKGASDDGIGEDGWNLKLTAPCASVTSPEQPIDTFQSPFLQLRWRANGLGSAQPYVEWTTRKAPDFSPDRRVCFDPVETTTTAYTVIQMYKHPQWKGEITRLRIGFGNRRPGASVTIQAFFTQYDTRHDTTSQSFIRGCVTYFRWTRDINFLRRNINRMRTALRYVMTEHQALERKYVFNTWVGHDGRSGLKLGPGGKKTVLAGHGIGDNYWDILPFGWKDGYATILYYDALKLMAAIERDVRAHPEWNIPQGVLAFEPDMLLKHAAEVKSVGNKMFWNPKTGRFIPNINADGEIHDYGLTFPNLEAIYYDFATPEHAGKIMSWISGERIVPGDTAQGADIYHWRFGPRSTTKRNIEYYPFVWTGPETIPWGGQVQDGGAVLGWSYHDLMARLKVRGPDNTWDRLKEVIKWFDEVQAAGGYRKYYDGTRDGTLQGGGPAGGLGMDCEFFESVLVPQIVLDGFLGFTPMSDGFSLNPQLPSDWPELTIDKINFHDQILRVKATRAAIEVTSDAGREEVSVVRLPRGDWKATYIGNAGAPVTRRKDGAFDIDWTKATGVRFERTADTQQR